jgi:hypothetical protein
MEKYINFVFKHNNIIPPCEADILRISGLHSWYKHLAGGVIAYPLLMIGEEPQYQWSPNQSDDNEHSFHWRIIMDYHIEWYGIKLDDGNEYVHIPNDLLYFMKQFPIHLDGNFSPNLEYIESVIQRERCKEMCEAFWNELVILNSHNCLHLSGNDYIRISI